MNPFNRSVGLRSLVATGIFVVLASSVSLVSAADPSSASRIVKFPDLNISSPSDAHVLYMRVLAAAQVVCSYVPFATDADKARCVRDVIAEALAEIDQSKNQTPVSGSLASPSR